MDSLTIQIPNPDVIQKAGMLVVEQASALVVQDLQSHGLALEILGEIGKRAKLARELYREPKAAAFNAHRSITAAESKLMRPLDQAKAILTGKVGRYQDEQRRLVAAERARLEAEARKAEEERLLEAAAEAETAGEPEVAEQLLAQAEAPRITERIDVQPEIAKVEGVSSRELYSCEVVDMPQLVSYCHQTGQSDLLLPNMPALNARARSAKDAFSIPGCRAMRRTSVAIRVEP